MSEKSIENISTSNNTFAPIFIYTRSLPVAKFNEHCLINKLPDSGEVINLYISNTLDVWSRDVNTDFTLNNCLFGSAKLTENAEPDKYVYSGYSIGFDSLPEFLLTDVSLGKNVIIFVFDMRSSMHIDNKNKDILILGKGPT